MILSALPFFVPLVLPAQDAAAQPAAPAPPAVVLSMRCEGADAIFVDSKDAALLRALKMFDERLLELPSEIPDFQAPPGMLELACRLLSGGAHSISVGINQEPIPGMPLPFLVDLRLAQGSGEAAANITSEIAGLVEQFGMPLTAPAEGKLYVMPVPVPMWMGAAGDDFVLRVGSDAGLEVSSNSALLPEGARPSYSGTMDYGLFLEQIVRVVEMTGEDVEEIEEAFELLGILGLDQLKYEWAAGSDAERQHLVVRMAGFANVMRDLGILPEHKLDQAFLRVIPEDSTWAMAGAFDLPGVIRFYEELLDGYDLDLDELTDGALEEFERESGLSIQDDIIAPMGGKLAIYASDTTGGGGVFSMVAVLELADRERFLSTWKRMEEAVDKIGVEEANGYLRFDSWSSENASFHTLTFPGLPIPMEITMASVDKYAVFGLSPQSVMAALDQIASPERSLLDDAGFQDQRSPGLEDPVSLVWINTPRLMRDGYGTLGLATSALANVMRSPQDRGRAPGQLLPNFRDLAEGARPIVGVSYEVEGDFITEYRSDRSQLVNGAGVMGLLFNSPYPALIGLVAMGTATAQATQQLEVAQLGAMQANEYAQAENSIATIQAALDDYAINNGGEYPDSLEALVTPDENGMTYLKQRTIPLDPWGQPYGYSIDETGNPRVYSTTLEPEHEHEHE